MTTIDGTAELDTPRTRGTIAGRIRIAHRIIVDPAELAVSQFPGEGHPVLLIHGLGGHQRMWDPLVGALDGIETVTFDFPGLGRSHVTGVPSSIRGFAEMVIRMLDELGYERIDVLGYSFGGMVAQQLLHAHPDRFRRGVLLATAPGAGMVPGYPSAMLALATPLRYYSKRFYKWSTRFLLGGEIERDPAFLELTAKVRKLYRPHPLTYYNQILACQTWTSLPWLNTVQTPTLVVHGTDDPIIPFYNGELMAAHLPNGRIFSADTEGHLLMQDEGSSAMAAIRDHFESPNHATSDTWQRSRELTLDDVVGDERRANLRAAQPMGLFNYTLRHSMSAANGLRSLIS